MNDQPAKPENQLPTEINEVNDNDLAALGAAGLEMTAGEFVGTRMNYAKGKWTKSVIEDDKRVSVAISATTSFVVDPLSVAYAWKKWIDKKVAGQIGPGRPVDGFILPPRERLPDQDKNKWPWRGSKQEDPWQASAQITMKDAGTGELLTWVTASWGGRRAIGNLLKTFAAEAKKHPSQYPKVILGSRTEHNPDFGAIDKPVLTVVGWEAFGDGAAPPGMPDLPPPPLPPIQQALPTPKQATFADDIGDEVPFDQ